MISKTFELRFSKCSNKTYEYCKSDEEINAWIRDFNIELYAVYEQIDYNNFKSKPVFNLLELYDV